MKLSTKAAIYSGIVFPGAGYFVVKKNTHGVVSSLITIAGLVVVVIGAFHKAQIIADKIIAGVIPFDVALIREQIFITPGLFSPDAVSLISIVIGAIWLVGIVDSWRIGVSMQVAKA